MKLSQSISEYVAFRKALGVVGRTDRFILQAFAKAMGKEIDIRAVQPDRVSAFFPETARLLRIGIVSIAH